jgi:hypothetical protein
MLHAEAAADHKEAYQCIYQQLKRLGHQDRCRLGDIANLQNQGMTSKFKAASRMDPGAKIFPRNKLGSA